MNTPFHIPAHPDEIDQFVEALARNPERAEELKSRLRNRLADRDASRGGQRAAPVEPDDLEDFWDNVPI
ncbi:MAG: hypothetical protein AAF771_01955 [Pseudomonadota bacterium]